VRLTLGVDVSDGLRVKRQLGVICVEGELDLATSDLIFEECVAGNTPEVVVDLTQLTFMDCSGYEALAAARSALEGEGRVLTFRNPRGAPAKLLGLIASLESAASRGALAPSGLNGSLLPAVGSDSGSLVAPM
jgi:anti-anti-sigma factor